MSNTHSKIIKQVQIDWTADHRGRLFQNPTGYANKEHVHYGLHKGSSDTIGFEYLIITEEMIGKKIPIFSSIEVKSKAYPKLSKDQIVWLNMIVKCGGRAYIAREHEDRYILEVWE